MPDSIILAQSLLTGGKLIASDGDLIKIYEKENENLGDKKWKQR